MINENFRKSIYSLKNFEISDFREYLISCCSHLKFNFLIVSELFTSSFLRFVLHNICKGHCSVISSIILLSKTTDQVVKHNRHIKSRTILL